MLQTMRFLGKLGANVPAMSSKEWENIFSFLDYFMIVKEDGTKGFVDFDWSKVWEILFLLDKVKD